MTVPNLSKKIASSLLLGLAITAGSGGLATVSAASQDDVAFRPIQRPIQRSYNKQTTQAGGSWYSLITARDASGNLRPVVEADADHETYAYSVNKVAVALAVMDKVDRGELKLDQKVELTPDIIASGSGIYFLQGVYGDQITIAGLLDSMLLVSDNTAVRLIGKVLPGPEINQILAAKGFPNTHVDPLPDNPNRFYLGQTTPREMNGILTGLANKTLLSASSSDHLLNIMRWVNGYNDGVRRNMSSQERSTVAIKYGAFEDSRHEVGIMFDAQNKPKLVFALFNEGLGDIGNYGATNPAVEAEAALGRVMFDTINAQP